tara:strand:- start:13551 stop:14147 length:597 start_codon:yes stop_codon:yes gene_type:complete
MKSFLIWLMKRKSWYWLLMKVVPYVRFSLYYTKLRGFQYHQCYSIIQPADILLTIDKKKLTTLLVPGNFTHAAIFHSRDGEWEVSEMTHVNHSQSCLFDIFKEADRVVVLRPSFDENYKQAFIEKCKSFVNAKYDVAFELGNEALFCSELVYESDFERRLDFDLSDLAGLGRRYLSPDGIYACKNLTLVFDSDLCTLE